MSAARRRVPTADESLVRRYALLVGVVLVVAGVAGFLPNPIIGDPLAGPFIVTGPAHDTIHLAGGFVAIWIALALTGPGQGGALVAFGAAWLLFVALTLLSPTLLGILGPSGWYAVNLPGQLLHLALGLVSIGIGLMARSAARGRIEQEPFA